MLPRGSGGRWVVVGIVRGGRCRQRRGRLGVGLGRRRRGRSGRRRGCGARCRRGGGGGCGGRRNSRRNDRKSRLEGKSGSLRVDLGGRRLIKQNKTIKS